MNFNLLFDKNNFTKAQINILENFTPHNQIDKNKNISNYLISKRFIVFNTTKLSSTIIINKNCFVNVPNKYIQSTKNKDFYIVGIVATHFLWVKEYDEILEKDVNSKKWSIKLLKLFNNLEKISINLLTHLKDVLNRLNSIFETGINNKNVQYCTSNINFNKNNIITSHTQNTLISESKKIYHPPKINTKKTVELLNNHDNSIKIDELESVFRNTFSKTE